MKAQIGLAEAVDKGEKGCWPKLTRSDFKFVGGCCITAGFP